MTRRPPSAEDARTPDPRKTAALVAPRLAPATDAERAYDRERREGLEALITALEGSRARLLELARQGAQDPDFRRHWSSHREKYLRSLGALRSQLLAVDPLGRQSWGARGAARLLDTLEVKLPSAVEESWSSRPGGALQTWSADFTLISKELRRYLGGLNEEPKKGTQP